MTFHADRRETLAWAVRPLDTDPAAVVLGKGVEEEPREGSQILEVAPAAAVGEELGEVEAHCHI